MSGPTGKWGIARRQLLSHRSDFTFDPEGQGAGARQFLLRKAEAPISGPIDKVAYARPILSYLSKKGEQFVLPFCTLI
ncbi:hypothetical protein C7437_1011082 [Psychrobacillus insolitus]|uniref:Uncharacterized protein n=1 Tax=Psychrobacillus insolitus TaxID=1461 RepID=A0A2W7MMG1_9BACI|nr:hypothetical protein [Psychrobacillus insolitus]PZX07960.1 hypothetical protein C7437_1011082 [Psychrobacillus insolitus]